MYLEKILERFKKGNFNSIILYGATASGKSALGLEIAEKLNRVVIVNADSMQVYKEIPIITAQPESFDGHQLYSIISCSDMNFSVIRWLKAASEAIKDGIQQNIIPIVLGGTGMYISSLLDGFSTIPEISPEVIFDVMNDLERLGTEATHKILHDVDPITAKKVCDPQRIARALAVFRQTGKPISRWQESNEKYLDSSSTMKIWLKPDRSILYQRINSRFIEMLKKGAIDEAQRLIEAFPDIQYPKAIGLEQIIQYIKGNRSKDSLVTLAQQLTRNYAKRQETWFKNRLSCSERLIIENL